MIDAQSPSAQTRSSPGTANVASGRIQPRSSSAPSTPASPARTGFGALPTRADHGRGRDDLAVVELDPIGFDPDQAPTEDEPHPGPHQLLRRVPAESIAELRQDVRPAVDEDDLRLRAGWQRSDARSAAGPRARRPPPRRSSRRRRRRTSGARRGGPCRPRWPLPRAAPGRGCAGRRRRRASARRSRARPCPGTARKSVTLPSAITSAS